MKVVLQRFLSASIGAAEHLQSIRQPRKLLINWESWNAKDSQASFS